MKSITMKKVFPLLLTVLVMVSVISGCGAMVGTTDTQANATTSKSGSEEDLSDASDELGEPTGTVTVWGWDESEMLVDWTESSVPGIEINFVTTQQSDLLSKITTTLAAGTQMPDIVWLEIGSRGKEFSLDCWEILTDAPYNLDKEIFTDDQIPVAVNEQGDMLGIPVGPTPTGMAYKRPLAKQYLGTDDPSEVFSMIETWDDFVNVGKMVKEKSGGKVNMLAGLGDVAQVLRNQYVIPYVIDNKVNVKEALTPVFNQLIAFKKAGIVGTNVAGSASFYASYADDISIFYCAPQWAPRWVIKPNDESVGRWAMTQLPGGSVNWGGAVWSIPKTALNKSGAFAILKLYTTHDSAVQRRAIDCFSALKSTYEDPDFYTMPDEYFAGQDVNKLFAQTIIPSVKQKDVRHVSPYDSVVSDAINSALMVINDSEDGNVDIDSLLDQVQTDVLNKCPELTK